MLLLFFRDFTLFEHVQLADYLLDMLNDWILMFLLFPGQPKRHLLTTGWSLFVGAKRLKAGDSVLFIR